MIVFGTSKRPKQERCELRITGLHSGSCVGRIMVALNGRPGVSAVEVFPVSELLRLRLDPTKTTREAVEAEVRALGYGVGPPLVQAPPALKNGAAASAEPGGSMAPGTPAIMGASSGFEPRPQPGQG